MTNTLNINIWDREFSLPVEFEVYEGEDVSDAQLCALKAFAGHNDWMKKARTEVEKFCKEQVMEDEENNKKDNIFSYIKPEAILIKRDKKDPRVALMCKCRYEPEHGLAVVFTHNGEITVGIQDIIL